MAEKMIDDKTVVEGIVSDIQECLDNGKKKNNPGTWKAIFASNDFLDIQYSTVFEEELKKIIASLPGEEALSDIPAMFLMELLIAYGMVDSDGYVRHFVNAKAEDVILEYWNALPFIWTHGRHTGYMESPNNKSRIQSNRDAIEERMDRNTCAVNPTKDELNTSNIGQGLDYLLELDEELKAFASTGIMTTFLTNLHDEEVRKNGQIWREFFETEEFLAIQFSEQFTRILEIELEHLPKATQVYRVPTMFLLELVTAYGLFEKEYGKNVSKISSYLNIKIEELIINYFMSMPERWKKERALQYIEENMPASEYRRSYIKTLFSIDNYPDASYYVPPYFYQLLKEKKYTEDFLLVYYVKAKYEEKKRIREAYPEVSFEEVSEEDMAIAQNIMNQYRNIVVMGSYKADKLKEFFENPVLRENKNNAYLQSELAKVINSFGSDTFISYEIYNLYYDQEKMYAGSEKELIRRAYSGSSILKKKRNVFFVLSFGMGKVLCQQDKYLAEYLSHISKDDMGLLNVGKQCSHTFKDKTVLEYEYAPERLIASYQGKQDKIAPSVFIKYAAELKKDEDFFAMFTLVDIQTKDGMEDVRTAMLGRLKQLGLIQNDVDIILDALFEQERKPLFDGEYVTVKNNKSVLYVAENKEALRGYQVLERMDFYSWINMEKYEVFDNYTEASRNISNYLEELKQRKKIKKSIKIDIKKIINTLKNFDYEKIDIDVLLDARETEAFLSGWNEVEGQIDIDDLPNELVCKANKYEEDVCNAIIERFDVDVDDLAISLAKDIPFIMFANHLGIDSKWFDDFVKTYEDGDIPRG